MSFIESNIFRNILTFSSLSIVCSCSQQKYLGDRAKNIEYMQDTLGAIVIEYRDEYGELPQQFDLALSKSDTVLPHRGDRFGQPLIYQKTGQNSFYFLSYGKNGKYENGGGDDIKVIYDEGWLP